MNNRLTYYVSRKNVFTWLAVFAFLSSSVLRVVYARSLPVSPHLWLVTLPVAASLFLCVILLINGDELLFRTAVPFNMAVLYFMIRVFFTHYTFKIKLLYCFLFIALGIFYTEVLCGYSGKRFLIWVSLFVALAAELFSFTRKYALNSVIYPVMKELPDILMIAGALFIVTAMQPHLDGEFHPTWGDRPDGRRVRNLDIITQVSAFIMATRQDASNHIRDRIEVTEIDRYIQEKRNEGYKNFGFMHVFLAAYVRACAKYPGINRFLSGQRVYSRGNDIQFSMVVKSSMSLEGAESCLKLHLTPYDTVFDIYEKLDKEIERIKKNPVGSSEFDKVAKFFSLIPRLLIRFLIHLLRALDYFGMLPKFLLEVSPFHASIFFTSMASLGISPIVHHLYDFGNMPVFCSFGAKYNENSITREGAVERHRYIDYTFNTDERICDGFYYASVFKYIKKMLNHPEKLEIPPQEVVQDTY